MSDFPTKTLTTAIEDTRISDIPLATNDAGDVLGWTGTEWKKPDAVAEHPTGRRAYKFGDKWQFGPEPNPALNTLRIGGTAAAQAAGDVLSLPASLDYLASSGAHWLGKKAGILSDKSKPAPPRGAYRAIESLGIPTDPKAEAGRLAADWTQNREALASGTRVGAATLAMGAPASIAAMSGIGAGVGRRYGGEIGENIGAVAMPGAGFIPLRAAARNEFKKSAPVPPTTRETSEKLARALGETYKSEKALVTPEIDAAKAIVHAQGVPTDALKQYSDKYLKSVGPVEASRIPTDLIEKALGKGPITSFSDVDKALSYIKEAARGMDVGAQTRTAIEKYVSHMMQLPPYQMAGVRGGYSQYAQFKKEFDDPALGRVFDKDRTTRRPVVPPSEMADAISRLPAEGVEALRKYPKIAKALDEHERATRISKVEGAIYNADTRAERRDLAFRNEFAKLMRDKDFMAGLSAPERKAIADMVEPALSRRITQAVGYAPLLMPGTPALLQRIPGKLAERRAALVEAILKHGAPPRGRAGASLAQGLAFPLSALAAQQ